MASNLSSTENPHEAHTKLNGEEHQRKSTTSASWKKRFTKAYTEWAVKVGNRVIKNNWWM